jgi:hypothetical protein
MNLTKRNGPEAAAFLVEEATTSSSTTASEIRPAPKTKSVVTKVGLFCKKKKTFLVSEMVENEHGFLEKMDNDDDDDDDDDDESASEDVLSNDSSANGSRNQVLPEVLIN